MSDFSIITCVSNTQIYDDILLKSVHSVRRKHDIEFIPILNTNNQYSAAHAFNVGMEVAKSDKLILVHQDVQLLGTDWFRSLNLILDSLPDDWAIFSAAGISKKYGRNDIGKWGGSISAPTVAVGSVWHSDDELEKKPYWDGEKETQEIYCADECLMILNKKHNLRFDPKFDGFHFYGVDICLQARAAGYKIYGGDLPIVHYGKYSASMISDKKYWVYLRYLHNKWKFLFPEMFSTHMHWVGEKITSYIPVSLESKDGSSATMRAMGLGKVKLNNDFNWGIDG